MKKALILIAGAACATAANADLLYDNGMIGETLLASQLDVLYPFNAQMADDFSVAADSYIESVEFVGGFWNGTPFDPVDFNIYIYADDGGVPTGSGMDNPETTALATYEGVLSGVFDGTYYTYEMTLDTPFLAEAGVTYWFVPQAEFPFAPQWGVAAQNAGNVGYNAVQGFPILGTMYWTDPGYGGFDFSLYGSIVPAPSAVALLGLGGLVATRRR